MAPDICQCQPALLQGQYWERATEPRGTCGCCPAGKGLQTLTVCVHLCPNRSSRTTSISCISRARRLCCPSLLIAVIKTGDGATRAVLLPPRSRAARGSTGGAAAGSCGCCLPVGWGHSWPPVLVLGKLSVRRKVLSPVLLHFQADFLGTTCLL